MGWRIKQEGDRHIGHEARACETVPRSIDAARTPKPETRSVLAEQLHTGADGFLLINARPLCQTSCRVT